MSTTSDPDRVVSWVEMDPDDCGRQLVGPPEVGCPAHSGDWLYAAVRSNRRNMGLAPQGCIGPDDCPAAAAEDAHHDAVRAELERTRARLQAAR